MLFEDVIGMEDYAAKKASAWTGFFLLIGLIGWGCYKLYQLYLRVKGAFPQWWAERKLETGDWWASLSWMLKLAYVFGVLGLVAILVLII